MLWTVNDRPQNTMLHQLSSKHGWTKASRADATAPEPPCPSVATRFAPAFQVIDDQVHERPALGRFDRLSPHKQVACLFIAFQKRRTYPHTSHATQHHTTTITAPLQAEYFELPLFFDCAFVFSMLLERIRHERFFLEDHEFSHIEWTRGLP